MRLRLAITTIASTWGTMAAVLLLAATARASEPPPSECEGKPPSRDGFALPVARRLTRLLHQAAAAVPRTGGDGLRVRFDEVPVIELRDACWKLPDDLSVRFERSLPWPRPADQQRLAVSVTLSVLPADHWVPGEILESTGDLLVVAPDPQGRSAIMIFGARLDPSVVAPDPNWRRWDNYRGPYIASVSVSIVAAGKEAASTVKEIVSRFNRAAVLNLLMAEQERLRTKQRRATRN